MNKIYLLLPFLWLSSISSQGQGTSKPQPDNPDYHSPAQLTSRHQNKENQRVLSAQNDFGSAPGFGHVSVFPSQLASTIYEVEADAAGNIYVAGEFSKELKIQGTSLKDEAKRSIFLAKFTPEGSLVWINKVTTQKLGYSESNVLDMELEGEKIFLSGRTLNGDVLIGGATYSESASLFISSFDLNGNYAWAQNFPNTSTTGDLAIALPLVYVISDEDIIAELDQNGQISDQIQMPSGTTTTAISIVNGDLVSTGTLRLNTNFGNILVERTEQAYHTIFISRYNLSGNEYVWAKANTTDNPAGHSPQPMDLQSTDNGIYLQAVQRNSESVQWDDFTFTIEAPSAAAYVVKFDADGNALWLREAGDTPLYTMYTSRRGSLAEDGSYSSFDSQSGSFTLLTSDGTLKEQGSFTNSIYDIETTGSSFVRGGTLNYAFTLEKSDLSFISSWRKNDEVKAGYSRFDGLELDTHGNFYHLGTIGGKTSLFNKEFEGDGLIVAKTDSKGTLIWSHLISKAGTTSFGRNIKINRKDSTLYITGNTKEAINILGKTFTPTESLSGFVAKINAKGELQWVQSVPEEVNGVDVDSQGNVYISGVYNTPFTLGGIQAPTPQMDDAFLIKLSASGTPQWGNFYGGESAEYVCLVAIGKEDIIYLSGEFTSRNLKLPNGTQMNLSETDGDIFISRLTPDGTSQWNKIVGGGAYRWDAWPTSMEVTPDGNAALAGWVGKETTLDHITLSSPYINNNFAATISPNGNINWAKIIKTDFVPINYNEMDIDEKGNIYVGGRLNGNFEFTENYHGNQNGFYIAKYKTDGSFDYAKTVNAYASTPVGGFAVSKEDDIFVNGFFTGSASINGTIYNHSSSTGFFLNIADRPVKPVALSIPSINITGKTSTFTLTGKGLADEVILQVEPEGIVESYTVEGDQLIITWNTDFIAESTNARTSGNGSIEVKISVAYRNNRGTSSFSEPFTVLLENQINGIEEDLFGGQLSLYPNPSTGFITLELPTPQVSNVRVNILDIRGREVMASSIPGGETSVRIATDQLTKGIYIVQFHLPVKGSVAKRFLKK